MRHVKSTAINTFSKNKSNKKSSIKQLSILSAVALCASSNFSIAESDANKCEASCKCSNAAFYADHALLRLQPEIGIDYGFARTKFKQGEGDKMLNRTVAPINVFFGLDFTEHFGVELGYGETRRKNKAVTLRPGEFSPGGDNIYPPNEYQTYDTSFSISQPYISLKYMHPVGEKLQLFGAVGITAMKMNASWENIKDQEEGTPAPVMIAQRSKTITLRKTIPLVKVGFYYPLINSFSLRFATTWFQTSKLQTFIPATAPGNHDMNIKQKNSIQYSIGIVYLI